MRHKNILRHPLLFLVMVALLSGVSATLTARQNSGAELDQNEVGHRLSALQQDISELQQRLRSSRAERQSEQERLRKLDLAIQESARRLRELDRQKSAHAQTLKQLEAQRDAQVAKLRQRQDLLSRQIDATYRLARESRIKLVLNQDSLAQVSRMLAYYDHINRAQVEKINALKAILNELDQIHSNIGQELSRINAVQNKQQEVQDRRQLQRTDREALLATLDAKIDDEEAHLHELERDREDLEELLRKLTDVLADIPADLGKHRGVAAQKGKLAPPIKGPVVHAFGQRRAAGLYWQGWLIQADAGTEVSNIAYGRVAFADWLRGYGLLMIIDHGQGFMSLYGYNESLLWDVGDWVEPGAIIATVGGGQGGEHGLYFELRKDGKAVDPAAWLKR